MRGYELQQTLQDVHAEKGTADDLGAATTFGNGRLNSYRAVTNNTLPGGG